MAGGGMSNRDIAQALFVTVKTIEMHLGHVYKKLNLTGRTQLAAALAPRVQSPPRVSSAHGSPDRRQHRCKAHRRSLAAHRSQLRLGQDRSHSQDLASDTPRSLINERVPDRPGRTEAKIGSNAPVSRTHQQGTAAGPKRAGVELRLAQPERSNSALTTQGRASEYLFQCSRVNLVLHTAARAETSRSQLPDRTTTPSLGRRRRQHCSAWDCATGPDARHRRWSG